MPADYLSRLAATMPLVQTLAAWGQNPDNVTNTNWISFNIYNDDTVKTEKSTN